MAIRYTVDELKSLRDSPFTVRPPGLPSAEQWMGPPTDNTRNTTRLPTERTKSHDSTSLLDHQNRRPGVERHVSRNSANPEDIILGPPRTSFMSATSVRNTGKYLDSPDRPPLRDADSRDRLNFRPKVDGENDRLRDGRGNNLRAKRGDGDQDSDGWSTVKPRKSFGTEGAERFNGRMGVDRHREERRFKEREDRDGKDRPRGFDTFPKDKDHDHEHDRETRKSGIVRGRNEPTWRDREANKEKDLDMPPTPRERNSNGDRYGDRARGWREKEPDKDRGDRGDRGERRWERDRNQREEREPEWLDEPVEPKNHTRTQEDFQKWKEQMQEKDKGSSIPANTSVDDTHFKPDAGASFFGFEKPHKVETPLALETGPDKFFGMWAGKPDSSAEVDADSKKESVTKAKTVGKASRFTSFFTPTTEEPPRRQTDPPPSMPHPQAPPQIGLDALFQQNSSQSTADKEAFQLLLQKLQSQTLSGTDSAPPSYPSLQPRSSGQEKMQTNHMNSPEPYQQYHRQEEPRSSTRVSREPTNLQNLMNQQRQAAGIHSTVRPEQMLQELVGQRQNALSQSSVRPDAPPSRNSNTDFLMDLMQSAKAAPEPQRSEQMLGGMPPQSTQRQQRQQELMEREQELRREAAQRDRSASQRGRPAPPPGFFEDPAIFQRGPPPQQERQGGQPQPTQILQRPPPPGLDMGWDRAAPQLPPQHRINQNMPPPPGLSGGPNRGIPMPQQAMFPPGFPMNSFAPPESMAGPPRNMMQPPPGFFNAPPPGFMPPGMGGFQSGPEGLAFGGPFDGRGPPHQGAFRRQ